MLQRRPRYRPNNGDGFHLLLGGADEVIERSPRKPPKAVGRYKLEKLNVCEAQTQSP
jgi:hypothetical protein